MNGKLYLYLIFIYTFLIYNPLKSQVLGFKFFKGNTYLGNKVFENRKRADKWEIYTGPFSTPSKFHESGWKSNFAFEIEYSPQKLKRFSSSLFLHRFLYSQSHCLDNSLKNYFTYKVIFTQFSGQVNYHLIKDCLFKPFKLDPSIFLSYNTITLLNNSKNSFDIVNTGSKSIVAYEYDGIQFNNKHMLTSGSVSIGIKMNYLIPLKNDITLIATFASEFGLTDGLKFNFYKIEDQEIVLTSNFLNIQNRYFGFGIQKQFK